MKNVKRVALPDFAGKCVLSRTFGLEDLQISRGEEAVEVSPCASERGKVMVEVDLSGGSEIEFLSIEVLDLLLSSYENHFTEFKISKKLGFARLKWKAYKIYIYESGKFKIRFAHSREDALRMLNRVLNLIRGSLLCSECGRPSVECALGICGNCLKDDSCRNIRLDESFNSPLLIRGYDVIASSFPDFEKLKNCFLEEDEGWKMTRNRIERKLREAVEYSMSFTLEADGLMEMGMGVFLTGLAWDFFRFLDSVENVFFQNEFRIQDLKSEFATLFEKSLELKRELLYALTFQDSKIGSYDDVLSEIEDLFTEIENSNAGERLNHGLKDLECSVLGFVVILESF
ncbi:MAG: hypothetical protein ACOCZP_03245 [Candidatus Hadarchaeota archaeon]